MSKRPMTNGRVDDEQPSKLGGILKTFLADDVDAVTDTLMDDLIKPRVDNLKKDLIRRIKEGVVDTFEDALESIIFGKKRSSSSHSFSSGKTNYTIYSSNTSSGSKVEVVTNSTNLKRIVIGSYSDAVDVLNELMTDVKRYGKATVADYYQLCNVPTVSTDYNYGWKQLIEISISRDRDGNGYILDLPKPISV